jgi:transposase
MRYELTDYEWGVIRPMLPNKPRGVPRVDDRRVLNGIFWILRSGAPGSTHGWASSVFVICQPNGLAKARCWASSHNKVLSRTGLCPRRSPLPGNGISRPETNAPKRAPNPNAPLQRLSTHR